MIHEMMFWLFYSRNQARGQGKHPRVPRQWRVWWWRREMQEKTWQRFKGEYMHTFYCPCIKLLFQIPNAKQILPGNKAMNDQMGLLREQWRCSTPGGNCGSKHCFVQANTNNHFLLEFRELESWAAMIMSFLCLPQSSFWYHTTFRAQRSPICYNWHTSK